MLVLVIPSLRTFLMFAWTLLWSAVGIVVMILDPTGHLYSFLARKGWSPQTLWIGGVDVTVKGAEEVDWKKPYVICANHESQVDIPVLFAHLPTGIRFLAKRSLFYIPIFGWMLFVAGFVPVDRAARKRSLKSIKRSSKRLRKGPSLLVFPEGTRSPDGCIQPFKSGAFVMAIQASVPILPVVIRGTYEIVSKERLDIQPGPAELVIGKPIPTDQLDLKDKDQLKKETKKIMETMKKTGEPYA